MILKKNLNEQIYDSLRQDIIEQKIQFSEKLINRDLRERFDVSSTPVRDAINRLYQDGLVEEISNVGAKVISFDLKFALDVNEVIAALNMEAIRLSFKKNDLKILVPVLENSIEMQKKYVEDIQYFDYDSKFHMTFFDFSFNEKFKATFVQYQTLWELLIRFYYQDKKNVKKDSIKQHIQILSSYKEGNIHLAQQYMEKHYQIAADTFSRVFE